MCLQTLRLRWRLGIADTANPAVNEPEGFNGANPGKQLEYLNSAEPRTGAVGQTWKQSQAHQPGQEK